MSRVWRWYRGLRGPWQIVPVVLLVLWAIGVIAGPAEDNEAASTSTQGPSTTRTETRERSSTTAERTTTSSSTTTMQATTTTRPSRPLGVAWRSFEDAAERLEDDDL